jgi:cellulose synthase/poly-beta-1,6-N-acetylglucosamine synthase-like glycosyltransferase
MLHALAWLLLLALALPVTATSAYLFWLTLLSGANPAPLPARRTLRFDVVVPAHNEQQVIARVVTALLKLDWPRQLFRVLVVADNCDDDTAQIARALGATVLERSHDSLRGKGHALKFAFDHSAAEAVADAVVVIDADSEASANLLAAYAARIERGEHAIQAHYGILNTEASWRTRLLAIAKAAFHIVRSRARERLRLSCGIRGNGWCVTHELLRQVPFACYSLTEDLEYGGVLGLAGYRVAYADEAHADAEMTSSAKVAGAQRQRWESGRFALVRQQVPLLLAGAAAQRSRVCLDLALDLMTLPLTYVALGDGLFVALAILGVATGLAGAGWLWVAGAATLMLALHVARGWQLSGVGARGLLDLLRVPGFIAWRVLVALRPKPRAWVRTDREKP